MPIIERLELGPEFAAGNGLFPPVITGEFGFRGQIPPKILMLKKDNTFEGLSDGQALLMAHSPLGDEIPSSSGTDVSLASEVFC